jgi:hypothetical protein
VTRSTGNWFVRKALVPMLALTAVTLVNVPPVWSAYRRWQHDRLVNSSSYKVTHGFWQTVKLPAGLRVNAIHAALLPSGRILLIAGSGNKLEQFTAGTFKTLVFDPVSGRATLVPTPTDLFCAGHTFLPDGKLLVAGGTLRYEVLEPDVTHAGGVMTVKNESPDAPRSSPRGPCSWPGTVTVTWPPPSSPSPPRPSASPAVRAAR